MVTMEAKRTKLAVSLEKALAVACSTYSGVQKTLVQTLIQNNKVLEAYFMITQISQDIANETKNAFFLDMSKHVGVISANVPCYDMAGKDGTERTGKWRALLEKLIMWWTNPNNLQDRIDVRSNLLDALQTGKEGTVSETWRFSKLPMQSGTYIHEAYGEIIARGCAEMFGWHDVLEHIVPGRIVHHGIPWIGVTPDAISVVKEEGFHKLTRRLFRGESVTDEERRVGIPWMTLEIKTLHGGVETGLEDATVEAHEIDALLSVFENDHDTTKESTKAEALRLLTRKLELGKWMPKGLCQNGDDYRHETTAVKLNRTKSSKTKKACAFFQRGTRVYPTDVYEKLTVESVGPKVYPNLAKLPVIKLPDKVPPPKKRKRETEYQHVVDLKTLVRPGQACMVVYKVGGSEQNTRLFRLDWEKAPLMLTLNSDHFNQVMGQHMVARQYNEDVKSVFAIVLRSHGDSSIPFKEDPVQLAVMYAYDTGIQSNAVDSYSEVVAREIGFAAQGLNGNEDLHRLLVNSELKERQTVLYRRAARFNRLTEPTSLQAIPECSTNTDGEDTAIWSSDDEEQT